MDQEILAELLENAAKDAESLTPLLREKVARLKAALMTAKKRKPSGGLTPEANQAQQLLRNPTLDTTHAGRAKGVAAALVKASGRKFAKSLNETVKQWVVFEQAKLELSIYEDGDTGEHRSREDGPIENKRDAVRLLRDMKSRGVPAYVLARLPEYKKDFIAKLARYGDEDREHEDPENPWNWMFANGILDSVRGSMSEDEARLLVEAHAAHQAPENLPLRDRLEERLGRPLDFLPSFAAGLQRIVDEGRELTPAEAHVMFFANGQQFSKQTEQLTQILGLSEAEKSQVEALVSFVHKADQVLTGPIVDLRFGRIKDMLARIVATFEDHKIPHSEWLPRIQASLLEEEGYIDRNLPDAETFWAILAAVLEESETHELLRAIRVREQEDIEREIQRNQREYLDRLGVSYHVIENGHVIPGLPDEEDQGAVFYYRGDGVGEDLASTQAVDAAPGQTAPAPLPTPSEPEFDPRSRTLPELERAPDPPAASSLVIQVLQPRAKSRPSADLFEGME